jgi:uncharacterized membrane protein YfhO
MKRLGYTSVWMEVGTCGGTELTDALLDVGYEISQTPSDDAFFSADGYYIAPTRFSLPLGIAVSGDCASITEIPESLTRAEVQQYLFEQIFSTDDTLVTNLEPDEGEYALSDGKYTVAEGERLIYRFDVSGDRSLYFDCFDELSNSLTEPIYGSFRVTVNGREVSASYPAAKENGLLSLGEFSDERVVVEVTALKDVSCASFGLFSLDLDLLGAECEAARTVGFSERTNGLSGDFSAESETSVALFVPYDGGFSVKVNGKSVPYSRTLSGFISFALPSGDSHVEISFRPRGLAAGAVLCAAGLAATVFAVRRRKRNLSARASRILSACVVAAATVVFALIYILPTAINLLFGK